MEETDNAPKKTWITRSAKCSYTEKQDLEETVGKYAEIIECKQVDAVTINKKANY